MSHFVFNDQDLLTRNNRARAAGNNIRNNISEGRLKTTRAESDGTQFLTVYTLSDIMQGAALYKPAEFAFDAQDKALTDSFGRFIDKEGGGDILNVVSGGRQSLLPGNVSARGANMTAALESAVNLTFSTIAPTDVEFYEDISGDGFAPPGFLEFGNGRIPISILVGLEGQAGHFLLWSQAAGAFNAMRQDSMRTGFVDPIVSSAYRSYERQVTMKAEKTQAGHPEQAATPGFSKHGWGIAIDLARGWRRNQRNDKGQTGLDWMKENAYKYGFVHPGWAKPRSEGGTVPEEWHWEYRGHLVR